MTTDTTFNRWYRKHSDEFNKKRRERYAKDKEYRARMQESNAKRRSEGDVPRVLGPRVIVHNGKSYEVYTIGVMAEKIGRSAQTLRLWEGKGLIPKSQFGQTRRAYTKHQAELLEEFSKEMKRYSRRPEARRLRLMRERMFEEWSGQ